MTIIHHGVMVGEITDLKSFLADFKRHIAGEYNVLTECWTLMQVDGNVNSLCKSIGHVHVQSCLLI